MRPTHIQEHRNSISKRRKPDKLKKSLALVSSGRGLPLKDGKV